MINLWVKRVLPFPFKSVNTSVFMPYCTGPESQYKWNISCKNGHSMLMPYSVIFILCFSCSVPEFL